MYTITSRDRRVTDYVKNQAYIWLYNKIINNEYVSHGHEAENVLLRIKEAHTVTEKSYEEFRNYFKNDPYYYMLNYKSIKKSNGITTSYLTNYFIKFNDVVLPVGFIKDFFEDDYETKAEINEFLAMFADGALDDFVIGCQKIKNRRDAEIDDITKKTPCVFHTKAMFHVTNIIKIILTFAALFLCISYASRNHIIDSLIQSRNGESVVIGDPSVVFVHFVIFVLTLIKLKNVVRIVLFYISFIRIRLYVGSLRRSLDVFNNNTIEDIKNHFKDTIEELKNSQFVITDEMCTNIPKGRKQYLFITNFDSSRIEERLNKLLTNKRYAKLSFRFENEKAIMPQKRAWRKGIISSVLMVVILLVTGVPTIHDALLRLIASTPLNDLFDLHL